MYFLSKTTNSMIQFIQMQVRIYEIPVISSFCHLPIFITRLYCSRSKQMAIPVSDLHCANLDGVKYDVSSWQKIIYEINEGRVNGKQLPSFLTLENVEELLRLESYTQRFKYLKFLFKKEMKKLSDVRKKLKRRETSELSLLDDTIDNHIHYGLGKNSLMLNVRRSAILQYYNKKLANGVIFGQKIVFDLGYDEYMRTKERRDCAAQLRLVHNLNRKNYNPFDLYFCNASVESVCVQYVQKEMPNIYDSMISLTEKNYLDIFPKEKLIYLSPHATETLDVFDHTAVYIIGAFVDMVKRENVSNFKAQAEGIQSFALPLDKYILWGTGSKSLSINQVFSILMTLRDTGDWKEALKHIPTRKIRKIEPGTDECENAPEKIFLYRN